MHTPPRLLSRWKTTFLSILLMLIGGAMILLPVAGCQSSGGSPTAQNSTKPNFGPPMQDVRTEAQIVEMENEYNEAKNSQPTHHAEAQAEAARKAKEKEQQDKAKAAQEAAKTNSDPAK